MTSKGDWVWWTCVFILSFSSIWLDALGIKIFEFVNMWVYIGMEVALMLIISFIIKAWDEDF